LSKLVPIIIERIHYFGEVSELAQQGEYDYFISQPVIDLEKLVWKTDTLDQAKIHLQQVITLLQDYDDVWTSDTIKSMLWGYAESVGRGSVLWPMRFALSGREKSPDPFTLAEIFGKTETLKRIDNVIKKL
jgi:glutamyl/glutaminyl-tRNA synthetase